MLERLRKYLKDTPREEVLRKARAIEKKYESVESPLVKDLLSGYRVLSKEYTLADIIWICQTYKTSDEIIKKLCKDLEVESGDNQTTDLILNTIVKINKK